MNEVDTIRAKAHLTSHVGELSEVERLRRELYIEKQRCYELLKKAKSDQEKFSKIADLSKRLAFKAIEALRAEEERQNNQTPLVILVSQFAHRTKLLAMGLSAKLGSILPGEQGQEVIRNVNEIKTLAEETSQAAEKIVHFL